MPCRCAIGIDGSEDIRTGATNMSGRKPLSRAFRMAILAGALASVRLHLCSGGDVNATDEKGRSPLILAASRGHLDVCQLLLEEGADPAIKDHEGNDALSVAVSRGQNEIAALLAVAHALVEEPLPGERVTGKGQDIGTFGDVVSHTGETGERADVIEATADLPPVSVIVPHFPDGGISDSNFDVLRGATSPSARTHNPPRCRHRGNSNNRAPAHWRRTQKAPAVSTTRQGGGKRRCGASVMASKSPLYRAGWPLACLLSRPIAPPASVLAQRARQVEGASPGLIPTPPSHCAGSRVPLDRSRHRHRSGEERARRRLRDWRSLKWVKGGRSNEAWSRPRRWSACCHREPLDAADIPCEATRTNAGATRLSWPPGGISARGYGK
jgi:hypothetical protein